MKNNILKTSPFILLACLPARFAFAEMSTQLQPPETQLKMIQSELGNIQRGLQNSSQLTSQAGLGPQTEEAMLAFELAKIYFSREDYLSTIRELNRYLNVMQITSNGDYLKAQFLLARSYEELAQPLRAIRAYMRYLSAFVTADSSKSPQELTEVLQRLVALASNNTSNTSKELGKLISAVSNLELPDDVRPELLYLSSKASQKLGDRFLTSNWLRDLREEDSESSKPKETRTLYFQGLVEISNGNFDKASDYLHQVLMSDDVSIQKDMTRLALARLAVKQHKPKSALKYYEAIPASSPQYRDALYEGLYVDISLQNHETALAKANNFLKRYPGGASGFEIRSVKASLEIDADQLSDARESINGAITHLKKIDQTMQVEFAGRDRFDHDSLYELYSLTNGYLRQPQTVVAGLKLFAQIEELRSHAAELQGDSQNITYTLGRAQVVNIQPNFARGLEQLKTYATRLMELGHMLSFTLRSTYEKDISEQQLRSWTASERRRQKLMNPVADISRQFENWSEVLNYSKLTTDLDDQSRKVQQQLASLSALELLNAKKRGNNIRQTELEEQRAGLMRVNKKLMRVLQSLREEHVRDIVKLSSHQSGKKLFALYMSNLMDEQNAFQSISDSKTTPLDHLAYEQGIETWKKLEFVSKLYFDKMTELEGLVRREIATVLVQNRTNENKAADILEQLSGFEDILARHLGTSVATILQHYRSELDQRMMRYKKWSGDIDFIEFEKSAEKKTKSQKKFDVQRQILSDQLQDIRQGVLW